MSLRPIRLLRSALPTAIFMLVLNGVAESVMAQTPPNYVCYLRKPSGEVVNLSSICGDDETEGDETAAGSLSIRNVQVTGAGLTGVIVNESDQPVRIGGLGYELLQTDGQAVLAGTAAPATDVLLPNEPVQFIANFSSADRDQLAVYADVDLELAIAPDSVSPVALDDDLDDDTVSGEIEEIEVIGDELGDSPVVGEDEISEEELDDFPLVGEDDDGLDDDGLNNDLDNGLDDDFNGDLETDGLDSLDNDDGLDTIDDSDPFDSVGDDLGDSDTSDILDDNDTLNDDTLDTVNDDDTFDSTDDNGVFDSDGAL
ncbi:MAG: hypothetical protein ACTS2F_06965 [Thainema sp.]